MITRERMREKKEKGRQSFETERTMDRIREKRREMYKNAPLGEE